MQYTIIKQNVGIDISKDTFHVCFCLQILDPLKGTRTKVKATKKFKNTKSGFASFLTWVEKNSEDSLNVRITLEATGVYHEQLVYFLHDTTEFYISIVLPNTSKAFAQSQNLKTKTDKSDAKMLGNMGIERDLDQWQPMSPNIRIIKTLCRERLQILDLQTIAKNRLHAYNNSFEANASSVIRLQDLIKTNAEVLKEVETEIKVTTKNDEILTEKVNLLCSIPGIGFITAISLIAETDGFELFTSSSQLVSYAGYDIVEKQSGSSLNGRTRISKKGNKYIRRVMYFPALTGVKHESRFGHLFQRVFDRTAIKMKGYVAVQRKMLTVAYFLFKSGEKFDPLYEQKKIADNNPNKIKNNTEIQNEELKKEQYSVETV